MILIYLLIVLLAHKGNGQSSFNYAYFEAADSTTPDYCNPNLCNLTKGSGYQVQPNIACNNDGELTPTCFDADGELVNISMYADILVELHNNGRNQIATGAITHLPAATRMLSVVWSDALQYMAELNCKRCIYEHDKCRNTPIFPKSGQNIAITRSTGNETTDEEAVRKLFSDWFKENKYVEAWEIANFTHPKSSHKKGHFIQIVEQNSFAVGCGLIKYKENHKGKVEFCHYLVCNYATDVQVFDEIYEGGSFASGCTSGTNPKYSGLCSLEEPILATFMTT